jgi:hypothetical protein
MLDLVFTQKEEILRIAAVLGGGNSESNTFSGIKSGRIWRWGRGHVETPELL